MENSLQSEKRGTMLIAIVVMVCIAITACACIAIATHVISERNEVDAVRQAALDDVLDEPYEGYVLHMEKCESRGNTDGNAEFWIVCIYTEEDGLETMFVKYMNGVAEVYEERSAQ